MADLVHPGHAQSHGGFALAALGGTTTVSDAVRSGQFPADLVPAEPARVQHIIGVYVRDTDQPIRIRPHRMSILHRGNAARIDVVVFPGRRGCARLLAHHPLILRGDEKRRPRRPRRRPG